MQLLTEAPPVALNAGDGVVAEVQLMQGREAVEGAAVHFHQAVVLQVPAGRDTRDEETAAIRSPHRQQAGGQSGSDVVISTEKVPERRSMHILFGVREEV